MTKSVPDAPPPRRTDNTATHSSVRSHLYSKALHSSNTFITHTASQAACKHGAPNFAKASAVFSAKRISPGTQNMGAAPALSHPLLLSESQCVALLQLSHVLQVFAVIAVYGLARLTFDALVRPRVPPVTACYFLSRSLATAEFTDSLRHAAISLTPRRKRIFWLSA